MKPFTSKHCTQYLTKSSPLNQEEKMTQSVKPVKKKEPNKFTNNYNAATGGTHQCIQDYGGNSVTPGYDPRRADQYKANAIKKYGSLEASRKAYSDRH